MEEEPKSALTGQITLALVLLASVAIALVVGFAWLAASTADEAAIERQKNFVRLGLAEEIANVAREQESVTIWDDAVIFARDGDQLWMAENLGEWMFTYYGHDRAYVLDERGALVHAMRDGETIDPPVFAGDDQLARELRDELRSAIAAAGDDPDAVIGEVSVTRVLMLDGRPAIVAARAIVPSSDRLTVEPGAEYAHLLVQFIDGEPLQRIAERYLLENLHFVAGGGATLASVAVTASDGSVIGRISWVPDLRGSALVKRIAPAFAASLLLFAGIAVVLVRILRRASRALQESEGRARHSALHDALTGLPNRAMFEVRLADAMQTVRAGQGQVAVLYLDLDRFKNVNDTLGHRAGDELVRQTARRLCEGVEGKGTVARVGGDEFAILLSAPDAAESAKALAAQMVESIMMPYCLDKDHPEDQVHVGVSIGVAFAPEAATEGSDLVRKADIALYEAKKRGRGCFQVFAEGMDDVLKQRRMVEADLREALAGGEGLQLHYQPLYANGGRRMIGAEALLRWDHPVHGALAPDFVVSIAEESGLMLALGDWVLREACKMAAATDVPWIAVNVSPTQLRDDGFARRVLAIIATQGIRPGQIQIEVTETVLMADPVVAEAALRELRAAGVRIALDDFGTGYSSMSYLRQYSIDKLKIDRSFIRGLDDADGHAMVAAIVDMAHALKLDVTAEGVETAQQRDALFTLGCNEMQGYLFSKPLSAREFISTVASPKAAPLRA